MYHIFPWMYSDLVSLCSFWYPIHQTVYFKMSLSYRRFSSERSSLGFSLGSRHFSWSFWHFLKKSSPVLLYSMKMILMIQKCFVSEDQTPIHTESSFHRKFHMVPISETKNLSSILPTKTVGWGSFLWNWISMWPDHLYNACFILQRGESGVDAGWREEKLLRQSLSTNIPTTEYKTWGFLYTDRFKYLSV